ncbi:BtrH N-terminal domain-containing protein, partial [bacterium]|nr:BtrH N-terminal domain-containing protein [bacterium]
MAGNREEHCCIQEENRRRVGELPALLHDRPPDEAGPAGPLHRSVVLVGPPSSRPLYLQQTGPGDPAEVRRALSGIHCRSDRWRTASSHLLPRVAWINGLPLVTYRSVAGQIIRQFSKLPGFTLQRQTFRDRDRAMSELDAVLATGHPAGLQTGVFWLPYFPRALRFHFNAHNLVVYGKQGDDYLISDPVFPTPVRCAAPDLARARFASGALAPRGKMYYFTATPEQFDCRPHLRSGIRGVCRTMLKSRFPLIGTRGIRFLAGRLERWPARLGRERAILHLGHVVRMQEEIGTGGAGFRFMFAAFLQESAEMLHEPLLQDSSAALVAAGDLWRDFAAM